MAENTTLNPGVGGDTFSTDDIGGIKFPRSKITIGADGTNDGDVSATNPIPAKGTGVAGTANAGVLTVQGIASMTPVQIGDNAGSITIDSPVGTPAFVRLSDGTSAIATLPVSMAAVPTGGSTEARQVTEIASLASIDGKLPALGQALAAASVPIVMTAAQIVTLTPPAAITGFATTAKQDTTETLIGPVTETAPASDTASSGLGGRLQRIAQRITSLIALLPASLGIKTAAASLSVAPASDAVFASSQNGTWNVGTVTTVTTVGAVTAITNALPAGTNAIGKLAANAGVTIGAVEIAAAQTLATVTTVSAVTAITNALPAGTNAIGKLAANAGVTIGAVEIAAAQTLATVTTVGAVTAITNALPAGTNAIGKLAANAGVTIGAVEIAASQTLATVTTVGTVTAVTTVTTVTTCGTVTTLTGSGVAHDGVDSGNPHKIGLQARTTWATAVADSDRTNAVGDKFGRTLIAHAPRDLRARQKTTITSSTAETTIVTAGAAGVFNDIFKLIISNTSATACNVTIKDSTAGSTVEIYAVAAGATVGFALPASDGLTQTTAANNWTATCSASVASIEITAQYVKMKDA